MEVQLHPFLNSVLVGDEWSASCPSHFTPRERAPSTHWIRGWVIPGASLGMEANRKSPCPCSCSLVKTEWGKKKLPIRTVATS